MSRYLKLFLIFFSVVVSAQQKLSFDSLKVGDIQDFYVDDYQNIYLYKNQDFSLTKYDSLGQPLGRLMMTVPFRVQSVENPLQVFLFSQNAQELKVVDQNLNEIQKIDFKQNFSFVQTAYAEDLQHVWLLDGSTRRLIQYNYRSNQIIKSIQYQFNFDEVISMLVYNQHLYLITDHYFKIYDLKGNLTFERKIDQPRKIYRQNDQILVLGKTEIYQFSAPNDFVTVFSEDGAQIVDKNSSSYLGLKGNKFYIYRLKK